MISQFSLTLKNNRTLNTTISSYSKAEVSNVQSYSRSGDIQSIVHAGRSSRSVLIQDNDSPESKDVTENKSKHHKSEIPENTISIVNITLNYPLVLHLQQISKDIGSGDDFFVDYDVRLAHSKSTDITFGASMVVFIQLLLKMVLQDFSYLQKVTMDLDPLLASTSQNQVWPTSKKV